MSKDYKDTQQHEKRYRTIKKDQSEIKNAIPKINNTLVELKSRLGEAEIKSMI